MNGISTGQGIPTNETLRELTEFGHNKICVPLNQHVGEEAAADLHWIFLRLS